MSDRKTHLASLTKLHTVKEVRSGRDQLFDTPLPLRDGVTVTLRIALAEGFPSKAPPLFTVIPAVRHDILDERGAVRLNHASLKPLLRPGMLLGDMCLALLGVLSQCTYPGAPGAAGAGGLSALSSAMAASAAASAPILYPTGNAYSLPYPSALASSAPALAPAVAAAPPPGGGSQLFLSPPSASVGSSAHSSSSSSPATAAALSQLGSRGALSPQIQSPVPAVFPQLEDMSLVQLQALLDEEREFDKFFDALDPVATVNSLIADVRSEHEQCLAKLDAAQREMDGVSVACIDLQDAVERDRAEIAELRRVRAQLEAEQAPAALARQLTEAARATELASSDGLRVSADTPAPELAAACKQYLDARLLYHRRLQLARGLQAL